MGRSPDEWVRGKLAVATAACVACTANLKVGELEPGDACPSGAGTGAPLLDVIFLIDNSSSMIDKSPSVVARLHDDFPRIMQAAAVDYRVVLLSRYGTPGMNVGVSENPICIAAPLGATDC